MVSWCLGLAAMLAKAAGSQEFKAAIADLKANIHKLKDDEIKARFEKIRSLRGEPLERQDKIDHFVVLLMENHAADMFFGCMDLPGFDGIKGHKIPKDPSDLSKGFVNVTCGEAPYVCSGGPGYSTFSGKFAPGADAYTYPYGEQADDYSYSHGSHGTAITMMGPEQIPVKYAMAKNFGVFNKIYCATPTASTPNHLMVQSATSCGIIDNIMYSDKACGGSMDTFPQFTIYDSMHVNNVSFALYMNSTCGLPFPNGTMQPPCHGESPHTAHAGSPIPSPDVAMEGVGRYKDHYKSQAEFYESAAKGTLPSLSWIMPHEQACDHPCYDNAKGERFQKDIYEALRAGPKWNRTLFLVVYDDAGGYYDHVVPPSEGVAADEAPCRCPNAKFDFRRLGLRTSGMLMSPWVAKGTVFQEPKGPTNTSQFDLTSVPATIKNLFGLDDFLTKRDAWAGSFHELLTDELRTDCPMHLPEAPEPAKPWEPAYPGDWPNATSKDRYDNDDDDDGDDTINDEDYLVSRRLQSEPEPQHCSHATGVCLTPQHLTAKQLKRIKWYASLTKSEAPDTSTMSSAEAERWLAHRWDAWMLERHVHRAEESVV